MNAKLGIRLLFVSMSLSSLVLSLDSCDGSGKWAWKKSTDPADVQNFLNGTAPYLTPVADARISAVWKGNYAEFYVFYVPGKPGQPSGNWGWKKSEDPGDVADFLNGQGGYIQPVKNAEIAALQTPSSTDFYAFYQAGSPGGHPSNWIWKKSTDPDDVMSFLNGSGAYSHPVRAARVVATGSTTPLFYVFCVGASIGGPLLNWTWKKSTGPSDVQSFLNGQSPYSQPVKDFEISSTAETSAGEFYSFSNQGTRIWIASPLPDERFVTNEVLHFRALVSSHVPVDGSQLSWTSNGSGVLGSGPDVQANGLPTGSHTIKVSGYADAQVTSLREFSDLLALYQARPAQGELQRISQRFSLNWIDGSLPDEKWAAYDPPIFNQASLQPSKFVVQARLDVLRHQSFSEPLPFGDGLSIYDHFQKYVHTLNLALNCPGDFGGGATVSVDHLGSVWWNTYSGNCKTPAPNAPLAPYVDPLYLLVHEGRHNEPGDPGHTSCNGQSNMDATLDGGSGHAWAALYTMWVYKYGLLDPPAIKQEAKAVATSLLKSRFCTTPTSSNPKVQAIVTELLQ